MFSIGSSMDIGARNDEAARAAPFLDDGTVRGVLAEGQALIQRGLREAYVIDATGAVSF